MYAPYATSNALQNLWSAEIDRTLHVSELKLDSSNWFYTAFKLYVNEVEGIHPNSLSTAIELIVRV